MASKRMRLQSDGGKQGITHNDSIEKIVDELLDNDRGNHKCKWHSSPILYIFNIVHAQLSEHLGMNFWNCYSDKLHIFG